MRKYLDYLQGHLIPPGEMITAMTIDPAVKFVLVVEKEVSERLQLLP